MDADYVIAIKRQHRASAPSNWQERILALPGVDSPRTPASADRMQIHADSGALEKVREILGEIAHIEPLILHKRA